MPPVRSTNGRDSPGMSRGMEPVVYRCPDLPALDWRLARPGMAGDQQNDPIAALDRLFQAAIDGGPRLVKIVTMKVDSPVGFDSAAFQPPVPTAVQGCSRLWPNRLNDGRRGPLLRFRPGLQLGPLLELLRDFRPVGEIAGERPNGGGYARPKLLFVRVEQAHG